MIGNDLPIYNTDQAKKWRLFLKLVWICLCEMSRGRGSSTLWTLVPCPRMDRLCCFLTLLSIVALLSQEIVVKASKVPAADSVFEGFEDAEDAELDEEDPAPYIPPPPLFHKSPDLSRQAPDLPNKDSEKQVEEEEQAPVSKIPPPRSASPEVYWDEDEFEGLPVSSSVAEESESASASASAEKPRVSAPPRGPQSYYVEAVCVSFLIAFVVNFFVGKRENEKLALAWAKQFATKDAIFEKNFSLLGTGSGDNDSPLLLKEGQNVFKFYASGRRFCQGLLATMELKSRHDLISKIYNGVVRIKDEVTIEVYMNDDAMDHIVFALARKKVAKAMQKELKDLNQYASVLATTSSIRKTLADELVVISESREVASDLITDTVLDQVFGEKVFEKYGQGFISMHFTDLNSSGSHKKMLIFKFAMPSVDNMSDMTRLIAIVPYFIDLVGRYKLSTQARAKTEGVRNKIAQELFKEQQFARQEAVQRKKEERRRALEEAEAKLSAEAIRKKEEKERQRQLKRTMPRVKMTRH